MTIDRTSLRLALAALMPLALLAGCTDKANPDTIDRLSVERWSHLIAHEAEKAYDYLSPGTRQAQTRENYAAAMNSRPVRWSDAKFNHKECEEDRCKVFIDVTYSVIMPGAMGKAASATTTQTETWIFVDGAWYFLPN